MSRTVDLGDIQIKSKYKTPGSSLVKHDDLGESILFGMLETLKDETVESNKKYAIRSSGLPYCEIRLLLNKPNPENFNKQFYTSTGTAIHETLQEWAPRGKYKSKIFGNWECTGCKAEKRLCTTPTEECVECKSKTDMPDRHLGKKHYWKYVEIDFKYKDLTGHIDMVLKIGKNKYVVIDFKTTDMEKKRSSKFWDSSQPSSKSYILQIRTYCTMLNLLYGLNIVGWHIISVNRSAPIGNSKDYHPVSGYWNEERSKKFIKYLNRDVQGYRHLKKLLSYIENSDTAKARNRLEKLCDNRSCKSQEDYTKWMSHGFFGKEKCEFLNSCTKSTHRILQRIEQELENSNE